MYWVSVLCARFYEIQCCVQLQNVFDKVLKVKSHKAEVLEIISCLNLNSGYVAFSMKLWSWERLRITSLSLFWGRRSSVLRNGRIEVNVGILTNILPKSSFTHIKQTDPSEVLGDKQGSQSFYRRLKFSRRMILTLYNLSSPDSHREERFLQWSSCRSLCL